MGGQEYHHIDNAFSRIAFVIYIWWLDLDIRVPTRAQRPRGVTILFYSTWITKQSDSPLLLYRMSRNRISIAQKCVLQSVSIQWRSADETYVTASYIMLSLVIRRCHSSLRFLYLFPSFSRVWSIIVSRVIIIAQRGKCNNTQEKQKRAIWIKLSLKTT